jgi:hypothetical protein
LGVKYDTKRTTLTVGGFDRFLAQIESVMYDYFRVFPHDEKECLRTWTQANKVRLVVSIPRWQFVKGLAKLREHGFTLQETTNLERIMR